MNKSLIYMAVISLGVFPSIFPAAPAKTAPRTVMVFGQRDASNSDEVIVRIDPNIYRTQQQLDRIHNRKKRCICLTVTTFCFIGMGAFAGYLIKTGLENKENNP